MKDDEMRRSQVVSSLLQSNGKFKEVYMMMTDGANENRKEKSFSNDKMNDIYSEISKLNTTRSIRMSFRPEEKKVNSFIPVINDKKFNAIKTSGFNKIPISHRKLDNFLNIKPLNNTKVLFNKTVMNWLSKQKVNFYSPTKTSKKSGVNYTGEYFSNELDRFSNRLKGYHSKSNQNQTRPLFHIFLK